MVRGRFEVLNDSARLLILLTALWLLCPSGVAHADQNVEAPTVAQLDAPGTVADVATEMPATDAEEITMPLPSSLAIAVVGLALLMLNHVRKRWHHLGT